MTDNHILYLMMDTPIVRIGQMSLGKNPFLDKEYFENRARKHRYNMKKRDVLIEPRRLIIMRYRCVSGIW